MNSIDFAHSNGLAATRQLSREQQKQLGQFMTPPAIARFMAARCLPTTSPSVLRVLDPAAGSGILAAAVIDALLAREQPPARIELTLCELDAPLIPLLRRLADRMRRQARRAGVEMHIAIHRGDFLLSPIALARQPCMDVVIANPPYFKIGARDPRAIAHADAVHGQPNIYGLFMAVCASLLNPAGRWCFITPRSWTNGAYFAAVRRHLLRTLHLDALHLFESRRDHFTGDDVLQEAMIAWATALAHPQGEVVVSSSMGTGDLALATLATHPVADIIGEDAERAIALPASIATAPWAHWTATLATFGLKVSTGPVVAFRAVDHLRQTATAHTVPLLWMQHIAPMQVRWPINKKREHLAANAATAWMLIPNANCVVMRRFSPKEDQRRITAAPYLAGQLPGAMLGLENHTNYISRPGGSLLVEEARGLAAFLNSSIVDAYLRTIAGNTQVNATDLRKLPLPPIERLLAIGRALNAHATLADADAAVAGALGDTRLAVAV
ncbi:MAG: Eco57I restriction-modification methylase domain-containing protein [Pseudomarimonas sp.]